MEEVVYANWRNLIKPRRVERDSASNTSYGKFVIRPLERGFGQTIGNGLRRVLLSSIEGCAVTAIRIDGKAIAESLRNDVAAAVQELGIRPGLAVVLVGESPTAVRV